MTKSLGRHPVRVRTIRYVSLPFFHKIVLDDLEDRLAGVGIIIRHAETREAGRGTPIALRVRLDSGSDISLAVTLDLDLLDYSSRQFNSKLVLNGLEAALAQHGVRIGHAETRRQGRGTPLAVRLTI